jgi:CBS domain-containing protein
MPQNTKIEEIMTKGVFSVDIDATIHSADEIIKNEGVRHVPVIESGKFVGLITERTLMEYSLKQLYDYDDEYGEIGHNKITDFSEVLQRDITVVYPEDSVLKAVEIMAKKKVDCLPVVDWKKHLVGILTSTDIMLFVYKKLSH